MDFDILSEAIICPALAGFLLMDAYGIVVEQ